MRRFNRDACIVIAAVAGIAIAYPAWLLNAQVVQSPPPSVPVVEQANAPLSASTPEPASATLPAVNPAAIDLAFWSSIKDDKTPEAFQEYLRQFPDGRFAGLARVRIEQLTAPKPESARPAAVAPDPLAIDLAFWSSIKDDKTPEAFQEYLRQFPDGRFAGLARMRVQQLATPLVVPQLQGVIAGPSEPRPSPVPPNPVFAIPPSPPPFSFAARLDMAKTRAAAAQLKIPLPAQISATELNPSVPAPLVQYYGSWKTVAPLAGTLRHAILLVTMIDDSGAAAGIFSLGPGETAVGQHSAYRLVPIEPFAIPFRGRITADGLNFVAAGVTYDLALTPDGELSGIVEGGLDARARLVLENIGAEPSEVPHVAVVLPIRFDAANARAVAAQLQLSLPADIIATQPAATLPGDLARYYGAWRAASPLAGTARQAMLIVTQIDADGDASGILSLGPGQTVLGSGPGSRTVTIEPAQGQFSGKIVGDGLRFSLWNADYHFAVSSQGRLEATVFGGLDSGARPVFDHLEIATELTETSVFPMHIDETKARAVAEHARLLLPAHLDASFPSESISRDQARYYGAWYTRVPLAWTGRHLMLIVSAILGDGTASGILSLGAGQTVLGSGPGSRMVDIERTQARFDGAIDTNNLSFSVDRVGYRFSLTPSGQLEGRVEGGLDTGARLTLLNVEAPITRTRGNATVRP